MSVHFFSHRMRKRSIEEDICTLPTVATSNRLSRFLPSCTFPKTNSTESWCDFPLTSLSIVLQRFCTRSTVTWPSTERSSGSRGRSPAQRRGSGTRAQTGPHLLLICLRPAPSARHEDLLLHCGRTSPMFGPVASWTTSATRNGNYRR